MHTGARHGLDAMLYWPGVGEVPAAELVLRRLLPGIWDALRPGGWLILSGIPAEERDMPIAPLVQSDEAFLSSTTREVQPIAHVDGVPLPTVRGRVSKRLAVAFEELVARDLDP